MRSSIPQSGTTISELPAELWESITSYLPKAIVQNLYSVNRPLLQIALSLRHRTAVVDAYSQGSSNPTLLNPDIRGRVRRIVVCDNYRGTCLHGVCKDHRLRIECSHDIEPVNSSPQPGLIHQILTKLYNLFGGTTPALTPVAAQEPSEAYYGQMIDAVEAMSHVREIDIRLISSNDTQYAHRLAFTKALLGVSFDSLNKLSLNLTFQDYQHILLPDLLISGLSALCVTLRGAPSGMLSSGTSALGTFIANHSKSLQTLEIFCRQMDTAPSFLLGLPILPSLSTLVLVFYTTVMTDHSLVNTKRFISQYESQLRSLSVYMDPQPTSSITGVFSLPDLHQLDSLTLGNLLPPTSDFPKFEMRQHLQRYRNTLLSLQLLTSSWTFTDYQEVFSGLTLGLKRLSLRIDDLTPRFLCLLADTCPDLEELVVMCVSTVFARDLSEELERSGLSDMTKTLREWGLESIDIIPNYALRELEIPVLERMTIVAALPRVRSFSHVTPAVYATSVDDFGLDLKAKEDYWGTGFDLLRFGSSVWHE